MRWDLQCSSLMPWRASPMAPEEKLRWNPEYTLSWGDEPKNLVRSKCLQFAGQTTREERYAQRKEFRDKRGSPLVVSSTLINLYIWEHYLKLGKETEEKIRGNCAQLIPKEDNSVCCHQPDLTISRYMGHGG